MTMCRWRCSLRPHPWAMLGFLLLLQSAVNGVDDHPRNEKRKLRRGGASREEEAIADGPSPSNQQGQRRDQSFWLDLDDKEEEKSVSFVSMALSQLNGGNDLTATNSFKLPTDSEEFKATLAVTMSSLYSEEGAGLQQAEAQALTNVNNVEYKVDIAAMLNLDPGMDLLTQEVEMELITDNDEDMKEVIAALKGTNNFTPGEQAGNLLNAIMSLDGFNVIEKFGSKVMATPLLMETQGRGSVYSEGMKAMRSDGFENTYGLDGSGVIVCVLSDSYNAKKKANLGKDVPDYVEVVKDLDGGTDEGRAMIELIHDVAPGAKIKFRTAFDGQAGFARGIRDFAKDHKCDVIVDDVLYFNEPCFQDGIIAQAVDEAVRDHGVIYISSSGNYGRKSYEYPFIPGEAGFHNFHPNHENEKDILLTMRFKKSARQVLTLQWTDPCVSASKPNPEDGIPRGAKTDLNIGLFDMHPTNPKTIVSAKANNVGKDAMEHLIIPVSSAMETQDNADADYLYCQLAIQLKSGDRPEKIKVTMESGGEILEHHTYSSTSYGHANARLAMGIAAANWTMHPAYTNKADPPVVETFSSAGGTDIYFGEYGERLGSVSKRVNPSITGPDGTSTTFFGKKEAGWQHPRFYGTSAAAPHVAGVVALLLQKKSDLTPSEVKEILESTAMDMDDPHQKGFQDGWDEATGYGFIDAEEAIKKLIELYFKGEEVPSCASDTDCGEYEFCGVGEDDTYTCQDTVENDEECERSEMCSSGCCHDDTCYDSDVCDLHCEDDKDCDNDDKFCAKQNDPPQCQDTVKDGDWCNRHEMCSGGCCHDDKCYKSSVCDLLCEDDDKCEGDQFCDKRSDPHQCQETVQDGDWCDSSVMCASGCCHEDECYESSICELKCEDDDGCNDGHFCDTKKEPHQCQGPLENGDWCDRSGMCSSGCCHEDECEASEVCEEPNEPDEPYKPDEPNEPEEPVYEDYQCYDDSECDEGEEYCEKDSGECQPKLANRGSLCERNAMCETGCCSGGRYSNPQKRCYKSRLCERFPGDEQPVTTPVEDSACNDYPCPENSDRDSTVTKCRWNRKHCKCREGFEMVNRQCVATGYTYTCPDGAEPKEGRSVVTAFNHCQCMNGYTRNNSNKSCDSCSTISCGENSSSNRRCVTQKWHCKCSEGYEKVGGICVAEEDNTYDFDTDFDADFDTDFDTDLDYDKYEGGEEDEEDLDEVFGGNGGFSQWPRGGGNNNSNNNQGGGRWGGNNWGGNNGNGRSFNNNGWRNNGLWGSQGADAEPDSSP